MMITRYAAPAATAILCCLLLSACGSGDGLARVKGEVTLNGEPLKDATVQFQPTAEEGSASSGRTDAEGRYELMFTFDQRGAMPGEHTVRITTAETYFEDDGKEREREERVPPKYNRQTTLKETVKPGKNTIDFDL